jgi:prolyl 4-hydroxylase
LTGHPIEHGEGLQVLNYPTGAQSTPHFDYLMQTNAGNRASVARSGQRVATLIVYLNDVPGGGETCFDHLGLSIIPRRGQAVYFEYANRHGHTDPLSLHSGAPVTRGEKWIATKWIRQRPFVPASSPVSMSASAG